MRLLTNSDIDLSLAADALSRGGLVAFPTETVYGLGADAFNKQALARVFAAKRRPSFDPLIIHIAECAAADRVVAWERLSSRATEQARHLMAELWPGPLTLILPKQPCLPDLATSALRTVALRLPAHPIARRLIAESTGVVAAPSANPFGRLSPTRAEHVVRGLGEAVDFIIDGGPCALGVESTVLDLSGEKPIILRPGGMERERIEALIGPVALFDRMAVNITAPGQLLNHYAPRAALKLYPRGALAQARIEPGAVLLFFDAASRDSCQAAQGALSAVLSESGDLLEAAAALFDTLYRLDQEGIEYIHAERVPDIGLGVAINDRLYKASKKD